MPITAGALTFRAYLVTEPPPMADLIDRAMRDLQRYAFRPPQVDKGQNRSIGWVNPRNLLDSKLTPEKIMFDEFLTLGLRVDRVTLNARIVKARYGEMVREIIKDRAKKSLGREEKTAILEKVRMELMLKQTPSTSLYEVAWNTRTHHVYFSATSEALNLEMSDLFSDTFHVGLTPLFPFLRADAKARKEGLTEALLETIPARLSPVPQKSIKEITPDEPG